MPRATKGQTLQQYIESVVAMAGTDYAVGKHLNYSDGSRIGLWKRGQGRPDELACIKLARWTGDDPLRILRLAGYTEMADLLEGRVTTTPRSFDELKPALIALNEAIERALELKGK